MYGGDEFIILLFKQDKKGAKKVVERIREEIHKLTVEEGMNIQISAGIACNDCLVDLEDMIKMADKDLYREKEIKKGRKWRDTRVNDLMEEVIEIRNELNEKIAEGGVVTSAEVLELSQRLDNLIVRHMKLWK